MKPNLRWYKHLKILKWRKGNQQKGITSGMFMIQSGKLIRILVEWKWSWCLSFAISFFLDKQQKVSNIIQDYLVKDALAVPEKKTISKSAKKASSCEGCKEIEAEVRFSVCPTTGVYYPAAAVKCPTAASQCWAAANQCPTIERNKFCGIAYAEDPSPRPAPLSARSHLRTSGSMARKRATLGGVSAGDYKLTWSDECSCKHGWTPMSVNLIFEN